MVILGDDPMLAEQAKTLLPGVPLASVATDGVAELELLMAKLEAIHAQKLTPTEFMQQWHDTQLSLDQALVAWNEGEKSK